MRADTALYLALEDAGFKLLRSNRHQVWGCPCGHTQVTVSKTPGKGRSATNATGDMKRALRECSQLREYA